MIKIFIMALYVLLAVTSGFALDNSGQDIVLAKVLPEYNNNPVQNLKPAKKVKAYSLDYRNIIGKHTMFNAYGTNRSIGYDSLSNPYRGVQGRRLDSSRLPQQMVKNITYDFSNNGVQGPSGSSFLELPSSLSEAVQVGAAFFTNLAMHEFGHKVVANYVGAEGTSLGFFQKQGNQFFLGTSHVEYINSNSRLPYTMGGEFFADLTFEHSLKDYRKNPNIYNKSLLLTSGTDFLWYCFYAFYLSNEHPAYDPITISKETGISRDMLFSVALAKTLLNAYRIYSGQDMIVPYFTVDKYSVSLRIMIPFEIGRSG